MKQASLSFMLQSGLTAIEGDPFSVMLALVLTKNSPVEPVLAGVVIDCWFESSNFA